ncbi:hypothetical protein QBC40DRAFT_271642 [Triangularia verruculosa]|uniref:Uncharacterized protein n=1 Tax=Triangularia verruculosa TaxID=2587418 RepID=A0AAN6XQP9_9PEZI|nr:hypothetical protein QBC40DRAFT_271642 [Triangularia verruculosa]
MYFFEMENIEVTNGVAHQSGRVCCRIGPHEAGFSQLRGMTQGFIVAGEEFDVVDSKQKPELSEVPPFKRHVFFHESERHSEKIVRIDVDFGKGYGVTISGFPMTVESLLDHGKAYIDPYPTLSFPPTQRVAQDGLTAIEGAGPERVSPTSGTPPPPYATK